MGVVPSPTLRCPDDAVCPGSSYSSLFMGGHNLKIHVSNTQAGDQRMGVARSSGMAFGGLEGHGSGHGV